MADDYRIDVNVVAKSIGSQAVVGQMAAMSRAAQNAEKSNAGLNKTQAATAAGTAATAKGARAATAATSGLAAATGSAARQQRDFNDAALRYANYDMAGTLLTVSAAIAAVGAATAVAFAVQERAFTEVERILSADDVDTSRISGLRDELIAMSEEIPVAFRDLADIASAGAALDIAAEDLDEFSSTVARFSAVTGTSVEDAGKSMARIAQYTQGDELLREADRYDQIGSAILRLGNISISTEQEVLRFSQAISPLGTRSDLTAAQITAMAAATASFASINVEGAGSAFSRVFANIDRVTATGSESLASFAEVAGVSAEQFAAMWEADAGGSFNRVIQGLNSDLPNLVTNLDNLGVRNVRDRRVIEALAINYQDYARYLRESNTAVSEGTALGEAYSFVADDLASKWQTFLNVIVNTGSDIGEVLAPAFSGFLSFATDAFQLLGDFADSPFGGWVVRVAGVLAGMVAIWTAWRAGIALATAGALAFKVATSFLGNPGLAAGAQNLALQVTGVGSASTVAAGQVTGLNAAMNNTVGGTGRMRAGLSGLISFIGGPWGLGILAGAAVVGTFVSQSLAEIERLETEAVDGLNRFAAGARNALGDTDIFNIGGQQFADSLVIPAIDDFFSEQAAGEATLRADAFRKAIEGLSAVDLSNLGDGAKSIGDYTDLAGRGADRTDHLKRAVEDITGVMVTASETGVGEFAGAMAGLAKNFDLTDDQVVGFLSGIESLDPFLKQVGDDLKITGGETEVLNALMKDGEAATKGMAEETSFLSAEQTLAAEETAAHAEEVAELIDQLSDLGTVMGRLSASNDDVQSSFNSLDEAVSEFGGSAEDFLNGTSDAAIGMRDAFRDANQATLDHIEAMANEGRASGEILQTWKDRRAELVAYLEQLGLAPEKARQWADEQLGSGAQVLSQLGEIQGNMEVINGENVVVQIEGDIENYLTEAQAVEAQNSEFNAAEVIVDMDGNPTGFKTDATTVEGDIAFLNGKWVTIDMDGNPVDFNRDRADVLRKVTLDNGQVITIPYEADDSRFNETRSYVLQATREDDGNVVTVDYIVRYSTQGDPSIRVAGSGYGRVITQGTPFASGGYTGSGGKYEPAGIVHKGEYVVPKHMVNQSTGLPYADALGKLVRGHSTGIGYAQGGHVSPSVAFPSTFALTPGTIQQIARAVEHNVLLDSQSLTRTVNNQNSRFNKTGKY